MTLDQACAEARLRVVEEYNYHGKFELNNQRSADKHDQKMQQLFALMASAEQNVRETWKPSTKKSKDNQ